MFRWIILAVMLGTLGTSGYYRRRAASTNGTISRRAERPAVIAGRLIIALPLFLSVWAYVINPRWMEWSALAIPDLVRWGAAAIALLTVPAVGWVLRSLGTNVSPTVLTKDSQYLVSTGPYRWIRHPLYTTGITVFLAIGVMAANWFMLSVSLITLIAIRIAVIPLEESALVERFGDDYRNYRRGTGSLLPRLFRD